jgi:hypothetical protein
LINDLTLRIGPGKLVSLKDARSVSASRQRIGDQSSVALLVEQPGGVMDLVSFLLDDGAAKRAIDVIAEAALQPDVARVRLVDLSAVCRPGTDAEHAALSSLPPPVNDGQSEIPAPAQRRPGGGFVLPGGPERPDGESAAGDVPGPAVAVGGDGGGPIGGAGAARRGPAVLPGGPVAGAGVAGA